MSKHRGTHRGASTRTRRGWRSMPVRAVLSVGIVLGLGSVGTLASWSDSATMTGGTFTAGTLDIRLNANTNNVGQGGTWSNTGMTAAGLVPGESAAFSFPVRNDGSVQFKYTSTGTATGTLATGLRFSTYYGGTATNTGTAAAGNRVGTCGGTASTTNVTLGATAATTIGTAQTVAAGATQNVCIVVTLDSGAANALQGTSATATYVFNAVQS